MEEEFVLICCSLAVGFSLLLSIGCCLLQSRWYPRGGFFIIKGLSHLPYYALVPLGLITGLLLPTIITPGESDYTTMIPLIVGALLAEALLMFLIFK